MQGEGQGGVTPSTRQQATGDGRRSASPIARLSFPGARCQSLVALLLAACSAPDRGHYDLLIRGGTLIDGTGAPARHADLAIAGDSIASIGELSRATAIDTIDATGLTVTPGFINTLSHATQSLFFDPRSQSDIRQGVTLEIFGESSMGPLNPAMRAAMRDQNPDFAPHVSWSTLGEYLAALETKGVATNFASLVGAGTVRTHVLGEVNVAPDSTQLAAMSALVEQAMREGALGLTTTLIYTPETFATTEELVALSRVAARHGGIYTAHIRSEGPRFLEAIRETIRIGTEAGLPVHIYHLKAAGESNWAKLDSAIALIDSARTAGVAITADMYTYTAGATGLDAAMPPWVQEGGLDEWVRRLGDPAVRARVRDEMEVPSDAWESLWLAAGSPERILLQSFRQDSLRYLVGKTIAEVSALWKMSPEDVAIELVRRDRSRVGVAYFLMSEENVRRQLTLPWVMFGSDGGSLAAEGRFLRGSPHPRAYGNFARLLGHYVRDEKVLPLEEAVRRLTALPASTFRVAKRGTVAVGNHADLAIFDAARITDHATFEAPHQYAAGMVHVFVNGVQVLRNGEPTGATPGRWVKRRIEG